jgi:hypothetical protein
MEQAQKPGLTLKIFGWLTTIFLLVGHFFKMMHWPGASVAVIVGSGLFLFFYLPLWLSSALKNKEDRVIKIIQFVTLFLFGLTALWKSMHWPEAGALYSTMFGYTMLFLLPYSFYLLVRTGKSSLSAFHYIIIIFLIVTNSTSSLSRSVSSNVVEEFAYSTAAVERSLARTEAKNERLFKVLDLLPQKDMDPSVKASLHLKKLSDSIADYVHAFRSNYISLLEQVTPSKADSMSVVDVVKKTDFDIANRIIVGNEYSLNTGKFSGLELKKTIEWFRDTVVNLVHSENKELIKAGIDLNTENGVDEVGAPVNWVVYYFYNVPSLSTITMLTNIELEVRNAENQVLSDLVNTASRNSNGNIAMQVAELGDKLEREKQEKQIALLQKESELSELRINSKNSEIDAMNRTIVWFVLGLIVCGVMLFFIIRSNLIRKKINKELEAQKKVIEEQKLKAEHQKELIEEKQREIIDSIKYARRIQRSLLTPEKYIEKNLRGQKN